MTMGGGQGSFLVYHLPTIDLRWQEKRNSRLHCRQWVGEDVGKRVTDILDVNYGVVFSADDHLGDGGRSKRTTILTNGVVKTDGMVGRDADIPCRRSRTCEHGGDAGRPEGSSV